MLLTHRGPSRGMRRRFNKTSTRACEELRGSNCLRRPTQSSVTPSSLLLTTSPTLAFTGAESSGTMTEKQEMQDVKGELSRVADGVALCQSADSLLTPCCVLPSLPTQAGSLTNHA